MNRISEKVSHCFSGENGELYGTIGTMRVWLFGCRSELEVRTKTYQLPARGTATYSVRNESYCVALCYDTSECEIDVGDIKEITAYDLSAEFQRKDGVYETVVIRNLIPVDIDLANGEWLFEVPKNNELKTDLIKRFVDSVQTI